MVNTFTPNKQGNPTVAADAEGDFVIAWDSNSQYSGGSYGVFGKRFDSGGAVLATEYQINSYTPNNQYGPPSPRRPTAISWSPGRACTRTA